MELTHNNASNSISHEPLGDHLEKIVEDFSEFKKIALANCSDALTLEELIDMYIFNGGVSLPADSNEAESKLPPHQEQSAYLEHINFDEEIQLTDEMAEGTSQNVLHIRYGDLKYQGAADYIIGSCSAETVYHSFVKPFTAPGKGRKNSQKKVNAKKNGDGNGTTKRKYIRKRYIQIIEANEDIIAHNMGVTNVNGWPIYGAWSQLLEMHPKNNILENLITFLEAREEFNVQAEPLRRTISDPQEISFMEVYNKFQMRHTRVILWLETDYCTKYLARHCRVTHDM